MLYVRVTQTRRVLIWLMLAALVAYFGVRAYLSPALLFNFSNAFTC